MRHYRRFLLLLVLLLVDEMTTMTRSFFTNPPLMAVSKSAMFCSKYGIMFVDHGMKKMIVCSVGCSRIGSSSSLQETRMKRVINAVMMVFLFMFFDFYFTT